MGSKGSFVQGRRSLHFLGSEVRGFRDSRVEGFFGFGVSGV